MDRFEWGIVLLIAVISVAIVYVGPVLWMSTFVGQRYDVTVTVQAIEHSTRWGEHTNVWAKVYGEQDITYTLGGHVLCEGKELQIGKTYRIVFVNRFAVFGYEVWGDVISIQEVEG